MRVLKNLTKNLNFSSQCIAFKNPKIFVQYEPEFLKKNFFLSIQLLMLGFYLSPKF